MAKNVLFSYFKHIIVEELEKIQNIVVFSTQFQSKIDLKIRNGIGKSVFLASAIHINIYLSTIITFGDFM